MAATIRRAARKDWQELDRILGEEIAQGRAPGLEVARMEQEDWMEWFDCHGRRHPVFAVEQDGRMICWAALAVSRWSYPFDHVAEASLHLGTEGENRGLERSLLRFLEQQAAALGYSKVMMLVRADDRTLLHNCRCCGYRDVGVLRGHGFYLGRLVDMVLLERLLSPDLEALREDYRRRYPFYDAYFLRQQQLLEEEMRRNGMIPSPEEPGKWIAAAREEPEEAAGNTMEWEPSR